MEDLIKSLPKVELHLHLDGSLRVGTVLELAEDQGVDLPSTKPRELKNYLQADKECESLKVYLSKFKIPLMIMQTKEALSRVAYELVEDGARDNLKYLEVRFAPLLHTEKLSKEEVVESVLEGLKRGEKDYNIKANLILSVMRDQDPSKSIEVAKLALEYKSNGVVALDLAGNEGDYPPQLHKEAFKIAKEGGLHRTVHAGEAAGANSVKEAINSLSAERIGHGVRIREDKRVLDYIIKKEIPLEVCPTSNLQTKVVEGIKEHPIREYYNLGIPVTVNTDNLRVSNLTLSEEYINLYNNFDFELNDILKLIINGVNAAFISNEYKEELRREFKGKFEEILNNFDH